MRKVSTKKITSIGGSALIEGIMMRGPKRTTVCVRTGENEIYSEDIKMTTIPEKCKLFKLPLLRGIAGLIDSMRLSYKSLMLSADKAVEAGEVEEEEPSKFEKWLDEKFGDKLVLMLIVGIVIGLFIPVAPFGIGFLRPVFKILLLPVSCGVGYELIKICGKHDNAFTRIIAAPGLWAQRITTKEPDDKMIEVAIEAMKAVIPDDGTDIINNK